MKSTFLEDLSGDIIGRVTTALESESTMDTLSSKLFRPLLSTFYRELYPYPFYLMGTLVLILISHVVIIIILFYLVSKARYLSVPG